MELLFPQEMEKLVVDCNQLSYATSGSIAGNSGSYSEYSSFHDVASILVALLAEGTRLVVKSARVMIQLAKTITGTHTTWKGLVAPIVIMTRAGKTISDYDQAGEDIMSLLGAVCSGSYQYRLGPFKPFPIRWLVATDGTGVNGSSNLAFSMNITAECKKFLKDYQEQYLITGTSVPGLKVGLITQALTTDWNVNYTSYLLLEIYYEAIKWTP
jgi:hypothetical protein